MYFLIGDFHLYVFNKIVNASVFVCIIIVYIFLLPYFSLFPYIIETFFKFFCYFVKEGYNSTSLMIYPYF